MIVTTLLLITFSHVSFRRHDPASGTVPVKDYDWTPTEYTIYDADSDEGIPEECTIYEADSGESDSDSVKSAGTVSRKVYDGNKRDDSRATDDESPAEYVKSAGTVAMKVYEG